MTSKKRERKKNSSHGQSFAQRFAAYKKKKQEQKKQIQQTKKKTPKSHPPPPKNKPSSTSSHKKGLLTSLFSPKKENVMPPVPIPPKKPSPPPKQQPPSKTPSTPATPLAHSLVDTKILPLPFLTLLLLSTGGLYFFWWLYTLTALLKTKTKLGPKANILTVCIVVNVLFVGLYLSSWNKALLYTLLALDVILLVPYFWKLAAAVEYVLGLKRQPMFLLLVIFFPAAVIMIQRELNTRASTTTPVKKESEKPQKETHKEEKQPSLSSKKKTKKISHKQHLQRLREYTLKAGITAEPNVIIKRFVILAAIIQLFPTLYLFYRFIEVGHFSWKIFFIDMFVLWVVAFAAVLLLSGILFFFAVDMTIHKRKKQIEEVLPDFLQLTAANIKAGMTVDRALWYAVRPRFGVLAKEIEIVAKETMSGHDLSTALLHFTQKYDSAILKRSVSLLIEGMESGGEIGDLLTKIATNIENQKIMMDEMAANVTTYIIFITFAAIVAAPGLFALSGTLIQVLQGIAGSLADTQSAGSILTISSGGIDIADFRVFAVVSLLLTATLSAMLLSVIKKGSVKDGLKSIPIFITVSLSLYFFASLIASKLFSFFI